MLTFSLFPRGFLQGRYVRVFHFPYVFFINKRKNANFSVLLQNAINWSILIIQLKKSIEILKMDKILSFFNFWRNFRIFPTFYEILNFFCNFLRFFEIWPIFNSQFCKFGFRYDLNDCFNRKTGTKSFIFGVKLVSVKIFRKVIQMWQKFEKSMKNANFCHFWAIFCHFLPIFAFFAIFSCFNTILRVLAEF